MSVTFGAKSGSTKTNEPRVNEKQVAYLHTKGIMRENNKAACNVYKKFKGRISIFIGMLMNLKAKYDFERQYGSFEEAAKDFDKVLDRKT